MKKLALFSPIVLLLLAASVAFGLRPPLANPDTASSPAYCDALVQSDNDLYLARENGQVLSQFTQDGLEKYSSSLNPSDDSIVYVPATSERAVVIVDRYGRQQTFAIHQKENANVSTNNYPLVGVKWSSRRNFGVQWHISNTSNQFDFYSIVPESKTLNSLVNSQFGDVCTINEGGDHVACVTQNDLFVDGPSVLSLNPFEAAPIIDSLSVSVGNTASTATDPKFQITLLSLSEGILIRVSPPNANWRESRLNRGEALSISDGDSVYAFVAKGSEGQTAKIDVHKATRSDLFTGAIAWKGDNLFLVETRATKQTLIEINEVSQSHRSVWEVSRKIELDVQDPIDSIVMFDRELVFKTFRAFGVFGLREKWSAVESISKDEIANLPVKLSMKLESGSVKSGIVLGWNCRRENH